MLDQSGKPARAWQEITDEAAQETSREKLEQLSDELTRALEERREYLQKLERERSSKGEKSA